jgi:hypothetical protein
MSKLSISQIVRNQSLTVSANPVSANIPTVDVQANITVPITVADISKQIFDSKIDDLRLQLNTQGLGKFSNTEGDSPTIDPTLFKYLESKNRNVLDILNVNFNKGILELQPTQDRINFQVSTIKSSIGNTISELKTSVNKLLNDTVYPIDRLSFIFNKRLFDVADARDLLIKSVNKILSDAVSIADIKAISINKALASSTSFAFSEIVTAFNKGLITSALSLDDDFKDVFKVITNQESEPPYFLDDYMGLTEIKPGIFVNPYFILDDNNSAFPEDVSFVSLNKAVQELLDATDDFLGDSFADDDQIASFIKVQETTAITADTLTRVFTVFREFFSETALEELIGIETARPVSSQFTTFDESNRLAGKNVLELLTTDSIVTYDIGKGLESITIAVDLLSSLTDKPLGNNTTLDDLAALSVNSSKADNLSATDSDTKSAIKSLNTNATTTTLISLISDKGLENSLSSIDSVDSFVEKLIDSLTLAIDTITTKLDSKRSFDDIANSISQTFILLSKSIADQFQIADIVTKNILKEISNVKEEYFLDDYMEITEIKPGVFVNPYIVFTKPNDVITLDSFTLLATFERSLNELLDATDDFLGAAVSDDDQIVSFIKNLESVFSSSDTINKELLRSLADVFTTTDFALSSVGKGIESNISTIDLTELSVSRATADILNVIDENAKDTVKLFNTNALTTTLVSLDSGKSLESISSTNDLLSNETNKSLVNNTLLNDLIQLAVSSISSDSIDTNDLDNKLVGKAVNTNAATTTLLSIDSAKLLQETITINDTITLIAAFERSFNDILNVTDDFLGSAVSDDDQTILFVKNLEESLSTGSDILSKELLRSIADNTVIEDLVSNSLGRPLEDNFSFNDLIEFSVNSTQLDALTTGDTDNKDILKLLNTNALTSTLVAINNEKLLQDNSSISDLVANLIEKLTDDLSVAADIVSFNSNRVLDDLLNSISEILILSNKVTTDLAQLSDTNAKDIAKTVSNIREEYFSDDYIELIEVKPGIFVNTYTVFTNPNDIITLDTIALVTAFERSINDILNVSDDFLGSAVSDDDQIITIVKNLDESISSSSDIVSKELLRITSDSFVIEDLIENLLSKLKESAASVEDIVTSNAGLNKSETVSLSDSISNIADKRLIEILSITDTINLAFETIKADLSTISDLISLGPNLAKEDSINLLDSSISNIGKHNADLIDLQETVSKTAAASFSDLLSSSDMILVTSGKTISNSTTTTDSGSLWNQSYFSEDYVLIGYVGTVTTI